MATEKKKTLDETNDTQKNLIIGTSVKVNQNSKDPDFGHDISDWQGRISEINNNIVCIAWDSLTLKEISFSVIQKCEDEGYDWKYIYLDLKDISMAEPRDTEEEVEEEIKRIVEELFNKNKILGFPYEVFDKIKELEPSHLFVIMNIYRELLATRISYALFTYKHLMKVTGLTKNTIIKSIDEAKNKSIILTYDSSKLKMDREIWLFLYNNENKNKIESLFRKEIKIEELSR